MFELSHISLSMTALESNIRFLEKKMGSDVLISCVVKGNAYGHGIEEFVPMLCRAGITHFSVFSTSEARRVSLVCEPESTIMIMGEVRGVGLEWAIANDVEFFVYDEHRLREALELSKKLGRTAKVHVELETGMNRTGFDQKDWNEVIEFLKTHYKHFSIKGICTHYAGAESIANYLRIQRQERRFKKGVQLFESKGLKAEKLHTSCSAAAMMYPKYRYNMVRIGIMQYGLWPSAETFVQYAMNRKDKSDPLKRVISWKSSVMAVKHVKSGEFIGYGQSYLAREDITTAVVPLGYAHGYTRELSNQGRLLIRGQRVGVVGIVNMNMLIADVSQIDGVEVGDEVVVIGKQGDLELTVASFSDISNQMNYELLTRLPHNIPRKVID